MTHNLMNPKGVLWIFILLAIALLCEHVRGGSIYPPSPHHPKSDWAGTMNYHVTATDLSGTPNARAIGIRQLAAIRHRAQRLTYRKIIDRYDHWFRKYSKRWLPFYDWRLLKAQCYQESLLDPNAVSPVGARGLCQFMPRTWEDVSGPLKMNQSISPFNAEYSIRAAAYYNDRLRRLWSARRSHQDRHGLILASYNAGAGHLIKAQKKCDNASTYDGIVVCLPEITGHHSIETMTYVERIRRWYYILLH